MEDSPLSITASVTGILTFVAAILAFIYVRYQTVMHSEEELVSIMNSVGSSIEETAKMVYPEPNSAGPGETELMTAFAKQLYDVELDILSRIWNVLGNQHVVPRFYHLSLWDAATTTNFVPPPNDHVYADLERIQALRRRHNQVQPNKSTGLAGWLTNHFATLVVIYMTFPRVEFLWTARRILSALRLLTGTPILWRWYRERDKVLKLVQKKDVLQSRHVILRLQILSAKIDVLSAALNGSFRERPASREASPEASETTEQQPGVRKVANIAISDYSIGLVRR